MKRKSILITFLLIILLSSYFLLFNSKNTTRLKIGNTILNIEIADTQEERSQGLSDRESLCSNCGLLFIFNEPGFYSFWMRRMNFDIDIIWIRNGEVVDITYGAKAPPEEERESPTTYYQSKLPADMVLEVNSGWAKKKGIMVGDRVER